jgi:hypothetical protein
MEKLSPKPLVIPLLCAIVILSILSASATPSVSRSAPATAKRGSTVQINLSIDVPGGDLTQVLGIQENTSSVSIQSSSNGVEIGNTVEWVLLNNSPGNFWYEQVEDEDVTSVLQLQNQNLYYRIRIPAAYSQPNVTFEGITLSANETEILGSISMPVSGILGDATGDDHVNFDDLATLASAYNTETGDPLFNGNADFNEEGNVDFDDLAILASNYNN